MRSDRATLAVFDIRDNIHAVQRFTEGLSFQDFERSEIHFYAVMRALEIISEASRRLPNSFRDKHASLPWKNIMGVGNVYRHEYDNIEYGLVWSTAKEHLSDLLAVVEAEINRIPQTD